MTLPIYLDYAAATPVEPDVAAAMHDCLTSDRAFGNPHSTAHVYGRAAGALVEQARQQVAELIHAAADEIVWTSGATESNNLALIGTARFRARAGRHIVASAIEHPAVTEACRYLQAEGFSVTYVPAGARGTVDPESVRAALRPDTTLVTVMHVNNEIGTVQDIATIGRICRAHGALFHVDAAQSAGRLPIDVAAQSIDLLSLSAHKMYGPKGVGALYLNHERTRRIEPLLFGGGQQRGLRPGTLPTHQVLGMGLACDIAGRHMVGDANRIAGLRDRLWDGISRLPGVLLNGDPGALVCHILSVSVTGVEGESLHWALRRLAVSSGSACASDATEPSPVLRALGRSHELARSTVRFSLGRATTAAEIDQAIDAFCGAVERLRPLAPRTAMALA